MASTVKSVHAYDALQGHIKEVRQLLSLIGTEVEKYESLQMVDYEHVGDLAEVEQLLAEAWEFVSETK